MAYALWLYVFTLKLNDKLQLFPVPLSSPQSVTSITGAAMCVLLIMSLLTSVVLLLDLVLEV